LRLASGLINTGTASSGLFLAVLVVSLFWGTLTGLAGAALASASYSYYFLKPEGFAIEDPNDIVAFIAFATTALVAGGLWATARKRQHEIERLYQELQISFDRAAEAEAGRRNEQLKAALLDALTHNLRTPLTAIKAAATALLGDELGVDSEARREMAVVINEETDRLNRFIGALRATTPVDADTPTSARGVNVNDVLEAALAKTEGITQYHRVVVEASSELPVVAVEAPSLVEALHMLIDNAAKYSPSGTTIHVGASAEEPGYVRISVTDQGPGIPAHLRERVFENFFRVPGTTTPGTGLGLSIARRLLESQGGRIHIESGSSGKGTRVVASVPTVLAHAAPARAAV
jgi:two-component system sensor histidine kinase KdpD